MIKWVTLDGEVGVPIKPVNATKKSITYRFKAILLLWVLCVLQWKQCLFYQNLSLSEETTSTKAATRGARIPPILVIQEQEPIPEFLTTVGNNSASSIGRLYM